MRYNLYSGGQDTARRREAIERISESEQRRGRVERQVAEEARLAWSAMRTAAGRVEELREQGRANEEVVSAYREQFVVGRRSLLDLLDAQNELFLTRGDLATQDYTSIFANHRVLAAMGTLLDALAVPRASESLPLTGGGMMAPAEAEAEAEPEGEAAAEPEAEMAEVVE
jgi:adhesin transport system outer membrane protein